MKKIYIAPTAKEVNLASQTILAGSDWTLNNEDVDQALSKEYSFEDEDFDVKPWSKANW